MNERNGSKHLWSSPRREYTVHTITSVRPIRIPEAAMIPLAFAVGPGAFPLVSGELADRWRPNGSVSRAKPTVAARPWGFPGSFPTAPFGRSRHESHFPTRNQRGPLPAAFTHGATADRNNGYCDSGRRAWPHRRARLDGTSCGICGCASSDKKEEWPAHVFVEDCWRIRR